MPPSLAAVCCGCVQPASTKPRKTYNILVPALFAGEPSQPTEPLDASMRRKIQKLQEYVQMSPAKIPKVSRRLMRRIKRIMQKPGTDDLGYIKVAVHAYCYLLAKALDENASYSASYFATELVTGPHAVVSLLLKDGRIELRTLGAELLAVVTHCQPEVDNQLDAIQDIIPLVCKAATGALHADKAGAKVQQAGDKGALTNPLDYMTRKDPAKVAALETACLRALTEKLLLCKCSRVLPRHFEQIEAVVLEYLEVHGSKGPPDTEPPQQAAPAGIVDYAAYEAMGVAKQVPSGTWPPELASRLLQLVADFTQDIGTVHKVMDAYYRYMDTKHAWHTPAICEAMAHVLHNSGSDNQFPVFTSMLRHTSSPGLAPLDCAVLVELAAKEGLRLPQGWALSALAVALQELPQAWQEQARRSKQHGLQALLELLQKDRAKSTSSHAHTPSAERSPTPTPSALAGAATIAAANGGAATAPAAAGPAGPATTASASGGSVSSQASKRNLEILRDAMLSAVAALAQRVTSMPELLEATAIGLRTATAAPPTDESTLAAAMTLACVAEAVTAAEPGLRGGEAQGLPGGALSPAILGPLLAVLQSAWPAVMRHDACRVLLALLPHAPQGIKDPSQALAVATFIGSELLRAAPEPIPATQPPARRASRGSSPTEDWAPAQFAALSALARCTLKGPGKPAVQLKLTRSCLKLARRWGQCGYRGGGGNAAQAAALVMVYNDLLAALTGAIGAVQLEQHRLPLQSSALASLQHTTAGLIPMQPAFSASDARSAESALIALDAAAPSANQATALEAVLLHAPLLLREHGEQLPTLLRAASAAPPEPAAEAPALERLQDKVNTLLLRRMSTLRRELVQVSELMRDHSNANMQEPAARAASIASKATPAAATAPSTSSVPAAAQHVAVPASLKEVLALSSAAPAASAYTVGDVQLAQLAGQLEPMAR